MKPTTVKEALIQFLEDKIASGEDPHKPYMTVMGGAITGSYSIENIMDDVSGEDKLKTVEMMRKLIQETQAKGKSLPKPFNDLTDV